MAWAPARRPWPAVAVTLTSALTVALAPALRLWAGVTWTMKAFETMDGWAPALRLCAAASGLPRRLHLRSGLLPP